MAGNLSELTVTRLHAVNRRNFQVKETYYRRNRAMFALCCKIHGRTVYEANGIRSISDSSHIVLLPKGSSYQITYEELGECFMIEFDTDKDFVVSDIQSIAISNPLEIQTLFRRLERLWTMKKPAHRNKCMAGLYEILSRLEEADSVSYQLSRKYTLIRPSMEYLETHYQDCDLDVDTLAAASGISAIYFRKIFTGLYQLPPAKYLQNIRIEKAKELLISDYRSVGEIASEVGFSSIYHFCKIFKKVTGCTPTEYAKTAAQLPED